MQKLILKWLSKKVLWWAFSFIFSGFFFFIIIFSSAFIMISSATLIPEIPEISPELPPIYSGDFIYPIPIYRTISSHFGYRTNPITGKNELHGGTDFPAPYGEIVVATASGIVEFSDYNNGGYGYQIVIKHTDNLKSSYSHNSKLLVVKGEVIDQGKPIALVGSTGQSTGNHLHFEIHKDGKKVNPIDFLNQ